MIQVTSGFDWNAVPQNNGDFKDSEDESSDSDTEQTDQVLIHQKQSSY